MFSSNLERQSLSGTAVFVAIPHLKEWEAGIAYRAIAGLHEALVEVFTENLAKHVTFLSALTGAIIIVPDTSHRYIHRHLTELAKTLVRKCIPVRTGIAQGEIELLADVDGLLNAIGEPLNIAARLASMQDDLGCFIHPSYVEFMRSVPESDSDFLRTAHAADIKGKDHDVVSFPAIKPNEETFPVFQGSPESIVLRSKATPDTFNAVAIGYDLPRFSAGDRTELSKRFRSVTDVFNKLRAERSFAKLPLHFSPGGDGGVVVLEPNKQAAYALARRLATLMRVESYDSGMRRQVVSRIGVHYGPVSLYTNAAGVARPTGRVCYIADAIASDRSPREDDAESSVVFSDAFRDAASEGHHFTFSSDFEELALFDRGPAAGVKRFRRRTLIKSPVRDSLPSASSTPAGDTARVPPGPVDVAEQSAPAATDVQAPTSIPDSGPQHHDSLSIEPAAHDDSPTVDSKVEAALMPWKLRLALVAVSVALLVLEHFAFTFLGVRQHEISFMAQFYQPLVRGGFPALTPKVTTILEVDSPQRPGAIRETLLLLLPRILHDLKPRVIVFDLTLQDLRKQTSEPNDEVTSKLIAQVHLACASTPVIFGFDVERGGISPHVQVFDPRNELCDEGYMNAENAIGDFRRVPLPAEIKGREYPSLAYAAASAYRQDLPEAKRVQQSQTTGEPLYGPLFSQSDYSRRSLTASSLLAGSLPENLKSATRDSVLVVGFTSEKPEVTPAGLLPGHMLQAAYIEAFVSGWLIREVPQLFNYILAVIFFAYISWVRGMMAQLRRIVIGVLAFLVIDFVLIHAWGLYNDFELVSITGVIVWASSHLHHHVDGYFRTSGGG